MPIQIYMDRSQIGDSFDEGVIFGPQPEFRGQN